MEIRTREYIESDYSELVQCIKNLQQHVVDADPLHRQMVPKGFNETYTDKLLKAVVEKEGKIYFAEIEGKIAGFIAGTISPEPPGGTLEVTPSKTAWVRELYVHDEFRKKGVGTVLMDILEDYFNSKKCEVILLNIFAPNSNSHAFYIEKGYVDRDITMIKELS
jgi:GNAT superfamily N-acetyltransferase